MPEESQFTVPFVKTTKIPPDPKGTAGALRRVGYELHEALADLIDNSIDATAKKVLIRFIRTASSLTKVAIVDDGTGMDEETLQRAMQYGVQGARTSGDLGKYGIGLKVASLSQCRSMSVLTRADGHSCGRRWTMAKMQDDWRCEILDPRGCSALLDADWNGLNLKLHGTIVLWDDLDVLGGSGTEIDKTIRGITKRLPTELGLRFHRFIESGQLEIVCDVYELRSGNTPVPIIVPALNPFAYQTSGRAGYPVEFPTDLGNGKRVNLNAHIWPANSEKPEYKLGGGKVAERQGFYFYRNNRLIQGGGWNGVRQSDSEPHSSLARVAIDLPANLDATFSLNIQKSGVVPPPEFKPAVLAAKCGNTTFEDYISAADEAYRDLSDDDIGEVLVPTNVPAFLQRKIAQVLGASNGNAREVKFDWAELDADVLFSPEISSSTVFLNSLYRRALVPKGAHAATDAPLLKVLLFLLLSDDLKRLRTSRKRSEWFERCNTILISTLRALPRDQD